MDTRPGFNRWPNIRLHGILSSGEVKVSSQLSKARDPKNLKTENGITHLGAYIGNGNTRNAPYSYHNMTCVP